MISSQFKTVSTSVRTARIAVLLDQNDEDWQASCLRIIEYFSSIWGGAYNIIVPTDGESISDVFWNLLEVYDADYIFFYNKTGKDLKQNHPKEYEELLERDLQEYLGKFQPTDIGSTRVFIDQSLQLSPCNFNISTALQEQLIKRLAPFHFENQLNSNVVSFNAEPHFPVAPLTKVLPSCDHANTFAVYETKSEVLFSLWLTSEIGIFNDPFKKKLSEIGIGEKYFPISEYDPIAVVLRDTRVSPSRVNLTLTPFEFTNINLSLYRHVKSHLLPDTGIIVAGETVFDFCLYYALSKLRHPVKWLPQDWLRSEVS